MSIFKKFNDWFYLFKQENRLISNIDQVYKPAVIQENARDQQTKKRVAKAFENQQSAMQVRALKPHNVDCKDPLMCNKKVCFKFSADKIISKEEVTIDSVRNNQIRRMKKSNNVASK